MSANQALRPRNRRLISIEGDFTEEPSPSSQSLSSSSNSLQDAVSSAFVSSRSRSPIPASHPSRATSATRGSPHPAGASSSRAFGLQIPTDKPNKSPGLWGTSWAGLQEVASTLLGSNIADSNTPITPGVAGRKGSAKDGGRNHRRNYSLSVPDDAWGPSPAEAAPMTIDTIATGSQEERLAKLQAEKRKMLLAGVGDEAKDAMGRYKRRNSLDRGDSIPSPTFSDDALVYVHKVKLGDSVAGLSVKFNCTQAVVRKTNRLWANDSIQGRKVAYLPVDACALRGTKVEAPGKTNSELLAGAEDTTIPNGDGDYGIAPSDPLRLGQDTEQTEVQPWTHDSWVRLPSSTDIVEIGRVPRRMLGWFPPARRKSTGYSDSSPPRSITSGDAPANAVPAFISSTRTSPGRTLSPARAARPVRASSSASKTNPKIKSILRGSGGVGSLHSNVRGPAPDELNKFVATHLPLLSIQDADSIVTIKNHAHSKSATMPLRPGATGPRLSFDRVSVASGGSSGASVEAMAGAVEGWLRKAGSKVKGSLGTPEMRGRARSGTGPGEGDLIELTDSWELNASPMRTPRGDDTWESEGHGVLDRAGMSVANGKAKASVSARDEEERLLRERFPPAGKVFEAAGSRS